jgi:hypothetical protein
MSRSGYIDDFDEDGALAMWRGQVASAIRGKRGQKFLHDLLVALEALPNKSLIRDELQDKDGQVCAIGALGVKRGIDLQKLDPEDYDAVAEAFNIAHQLAQEVAYMNDEYYDRETPESRFQGMLTWVKSLVRPALI